MKLIELLFGHGKDLNVLQMSSRAFVMFFISLLLIRVGGMRAYGKKSAFDMILIIVLGSVIARGIAGASGFGATVAASAVLVLIHRFVGWISVKSPAIEKFLKGSKMLLYKDGMIVTENLNKSGISVNDLFESLRTEMKKESLEDIEVIYMESNGRLSFVKKKKRVMDNSKGRSM